MPPSCRTATAIKTFAMTKALAYIAIFIIALAGLAGLSYWAWSLAQSGGVIWIEFIPMLCIAMIWGVMVALAAAYVSED